MYLAQHFLEFFQLDMSKVLKQIQIQKHALYQDF